MGVATALHQDRPAAEVTVQVCAENRLVVAARRIALLLVLMALALGAIGCGTKTVTETAANGQLTTATIANVHFAKTKFVLHAGLAFGAFHRYVYEPFRAGTFRAGARGRLKALLEGGAAALFAVHELRIAREDALSDDRLRPLAERIERLLSRLDSLGHSLKSGSMSSSSILDTASAVTSLGGASSGLGTVIKEVTPVL